MGLYNFPVGDFVASSNLDSNNGIILKQAGRNLIREAINNDVVFSADEDCFVEAYTDSNGRENSIQESTALFDTNQYEAVTSSTEPIVRIEATSLTESAFRINNCDCIEVSSGVWQLTCNSGTDEEKRAKIYKTLFYGTNGTDPALDAANHTSITAIKTNIARDIGKRGYLIYMSSSLTAVGNGTNYQVDVAVTFNDTTNNTDFSSWSYCTSSGDSVYNGNNRATWEVPDATELNATSTSGGTSTVDETGTDKTADETDNPATAGGQIQWGEDAQDDRGASTMRAFFICKGSATISITGDTAASGLNSATSTDFNTDEGAVVFTSHSEDFVSVIEHTIPSGRFSSTMNSSFLTAFYGDWESGASVTYKLTNSSGDDSGWLNENEVTSFTAFVAEPDTLLVQLNPKASTPTASYPAIRGVCLYE